MSNQQNVIAARNRWVDRVAEAIARDLFELGDEYMSPCTRLEFRAKGKTSEREDEKPQGGLCESAMASFLSEKLDEYLCLKEG